MNLFLKLALILVRYKLEEEIFWRRKRSPFGERE